MPLWVPDDWPNTALTVPVKLLLWAFRSTLTTAPILTLATSRSVRFVVLNYKFERSTSMSYFALGAAVIDTFILRGAGIEATVLIAIQLGRIQRIFGMIPT